jgi:DNA-binding SARP family transcriptional activator/pimeloyl-ACP methyl ester carboxylesterase
MNGRDTIPRLDIKLFGGLDVRRDGDPVALPQSKKTRALLAYLILKGTPQRRDALCELLWDIPDDPRAALRWSLSKLRPIVNDESAERLTADRERTGFERNGATVDVLALEESCANGLEKIPSRMLADIVNTCRGELLAGLELPNQPSYEAWRLGQQDRSRQLLSRVLNDLIARDDVGATERTALMRKRVEIDPGNETAHADLVAHLDAIGQRDDAEAQAEIGRRMLASLGAGDDGRLAAALKGVRPVAASAPATPIEPSTQLRQSVRFCASFDGVRIAYATAGSGPPLVKTANWLNHLEFDWESPVFRHLFAALTERNTLVRYDSRGNGLSDWDVENLTLDAFVNDLKAVVDAAGIKRFPLLAISQGCAFAVEFAVRYPERVSKLILYGGYARGWRVRRGAESIAQREAMITLAHRMGPRQSRLPPSFHLAIRARRHARTDGMVQRASAPHDFAGERRRNHECARIHRRDRQPEQRHPADAGSACARRRARSLRRRPRTRVRRSRREVRDARKLEPPAVGA